MSMDFFIFTSLNVNQTHRFARKLAKLLKIGDCIALHGTLGAGKSEFVRAIIQDLTKNQQNIPSPTFTMVQSYNIRDGRIFHVDLYRITKQDELLELGVPDIFFQGISFIEWPQIAQAFLPETTLHITIKVLSDHKREISLKNNEFWSQRLDLL